MKYPIKRNYEPLRMIALAQSELEWKFISTIPYPSYKTINWNNFHKSLGWTLSLRRHTLWSNAHLQVWKMFQGSLPFEPRIQKCFRDVIYISVYGYKQLRACPGHVTDSWFCLITQSFFIKSSRSEIRWCACTLCTYFLVEYYIYSNTLLGGCNKRPYPII